MERADVLQAWIAAWNARDVDALVRLADEDTVVALGPIELRSVEEGDKVVERQENAGAGFTLRGDRVARFKPYPDGAAALRARGSTCRVATDVRLGIERSRGNALSATVLSVGRAWR